MEWLIISFKKMKVCKILMCSNGAKTEEPLVPVINLSENSCNKAVAFAEKDQEGGSFQHLFLDWFGFDTGLELETIFLVARNMEQASKCF